MERTTSTLSTISTTLKTFPAPCVLCLAPLLNPQSEIRNLLVARIFPELLSRDHEDGRATWKPQGVGSEAYLKGTSQAQTPEDARKDGHIRGRSK